MKQNLLEEMPISINVEWCSKRTRQNAAIAKCKSFLTSTRLIRPALMTSETRFNRFNSSLESYAKEQMEFGLAYTE